MPLIEQATETEVAGAGSAFWTPCPFCVFQELRKAAVSLLYKGNQQERGATFFTDIPQEKTAGKLNKSSLGSFRKTIDKFYRGAIKYRCLCPRYRENRPVQQPALWGLDFPFWAGHSCAVFPVEKGPCRHFLWAAGLCFGMLLKKAAGALQNGACARIPLPQVPVRRKLRGVFF